ncbi:MAG: hypothetical protein RR374_00450 [Clostridia bacterium]
MLKKLSFSALLIGGVRGIVKFFNNVLNLIANVIVYFGLYVPLFYMIFIGGMMIFGHLDIRTGSVLKVLFQVGLILSIICSGIITIRTVILRPFSSIRDYKYEKAKDKYIHEQEKEMMKNAKRRKKGDRYQDGYYQNGRYAENNTRYGDNRYNGAPNNTRYGNNGYNAERSNTRYGARGQNFDGYGSPQSGFNGYAESGRSGQNWRNSGGYNGGGHYSSQGGKNSFTTNKGGYEKPMVYRSRKYPNIIVYEYQDRFELYEENDNRLEAVDCIYK